MGQALSSALLLRAAKNADDEKLVAMAVEPIHDDVGGGGDNPFEGVARASAMPEMGKPTELLDLFEDCLLYTSPSPRD